MKRNLSLIHCLIAIVLITSACSLLNPPELTPVPTATQLSIEYFTEEFSTSDSLNNWDTFTLGRGLGDELIIKAQDDRLLFDLGDEDLYVYSINNKHQYTDVEISMTATRFGRRNDNIGLICQMDTAKNHWYEFSVESGGLWYLYALDGKKFNVIASGGTNLLTGGEETNEYGLRCEGNQITVLLNGVEMRKHTDNVYNFKNGQVGINISSLNTMPVIVGVDSFQTRRP